jgi:hypothetical protein
VDFSELVGKHSGEEISNQFLQCIRNLGIENNVYLLSIFEILFTMLFI